MSTRDVHRLAGALLATILIVTACTQAPAATPGPNSGALAVPSPASLAATATPQPAVPPAERLRGALAQQQNGNYEAAAAELGPLTGASMPADVQRQALLHLGQSQVQAGAYAAAAESLGRYVATFAGDPDVPTATFWLGEARMGLNDGQGAADAYRRYLAQKPLLAGFVQGRIAAALVAAGDQAGAADAYRIAADAEADPNLKIDLLEGRARALRALQRYDEAVATYDAILKLAQTTSYRAQTMFEAGATLRDAGRQADATARWNELVATYPLTTYAAQALAALEQWHAATASALTRAQVEYGAGRDQAALDLLRATIDGSSSHLGDAHYWAALADRRLGRHQDSVRELDLLINTHPQNDLVAEAWYQKAESQLLLDAPDAAVASLSEVVARYPQSARAVQAMWRIAQVYEDAGRSQAAAAAYARAAANYPGASYAADARFSAGLVAWTDGRFADAARAWGDAMPKEQDPAMRARLMLWLGKASQSQGDAAKAQEWWTQAAAAQPSGYFGLRAQDLMAGLKFAGQAPAGAFDPARYASRGTPAEAEAWLAGWAPPRPEGQALGALPAALSQNAAMQRGVELWALGNAKAAQAELRQAQSAVKDDPWALYALAVYCRDHGLYMPSILAARRVLALAPAAAQAQAPRLIEELAYPTYYADLVLPEAQATNTDPLLFFALIYQESLFDKDATSYADARGLAQVIPSTGKYIGERLGDAAYTDEKLWRPAVSVRYGLWYLSAALSMFDDDALMALVGYNAGPSNAAKWGKLANGDADLYFEQVSNSQPRTYMERIYEHRAHYERLYSSAH